MDPRLLFIFKALFAYFVALHTRKYRNLGIFGLLIRLLFKLEFEKSTSTSTIQAASLFTQSNNLLENSHF
ncbi:hypothetical protein A6P54_16565 [Bacillus sp. MKU004]|nr:hypothetical protein A6P54_16565 [Bacillus sp. MKU004]